MTSKLMMRGLSADIWLLVVCLTLAAAHAAHGASPYVASTELDRLSQAARTNRNACGPLALGHALARMGHHEDPEKLIAMAQVNESGTSIRQLLDVSEQVGVPGRAIKADRDRLVLLPVPSILIVDDGTHCVVYDELDERAGTAKIFDPESNLEFVFPLERVKRAWTGEAIVFETPYPSRLAFWSLCASITLLITLPVAYWTFRTGQSTKAGANKR